MTKEKIAAVVHEEFTVDFTEHGMCRPRIDASIEHIIARILTRLLIPEVAQPAPPAPPAEEKPRDRAAEMANGMTTVDSTGCVLMRSIVGKSAFLRVHSPYTSQEEILKSLRESMASALRTYADEVLDRAACDAAKLATAHAGPTSITEVILALKSSAPKP